MKLHNPFKIIQSATIGSFVVDGGMKGKLPLQIESSVYPPNWDGAINSPAKLIIKLNDNTSETNQSANK